MIDLYELLRIAGLIIFIDVFGFELLWLYNLPER
jgi:hypothetical protein